MDSHNSTSRIHRCEGAATGVGGILRDVFSMGARPIAAMNSLRFGPLGNERTNYLFEEVVRGIAHYGNNGGVPTVGGEMASDDGCSGSRVVNATVVGLFDQPCISEGSASAAGQSD